MGKCTSSVPPEHFQHKTINVEQPSQRNIVPEAEEKDKGELPTDFDSRSAGFRSKEHDEAIDHVDDIRPDDEEESILLIFDDDKLPTNEALITPKSVNHELSFPQTAHYEHDINNDKKEKQKSDDNTLKTKETLNNYNSHSLSLQNPEDIVIEDQNEANQRKNSLTLSPLMDIQITPKKNNSSSSKKAKMNGSNPLNPMIINSKIFKKNGLKKPSKTNTSYPNTENLNNIDKKQLVECIVNVINKVEDTNNGKTEYEQVLCPETMMIKTRKSIDDTMDEEVECNEYVIGNEYGQETENKYGQKENEEHDISAIIDKAKLNQKLMIEILNKYGIEDEHENDDKSEEDENANNMNLESENNKIISSPVYNPNDWRLMDNNSDYDSMASSSSNDSNDSLNSYSSSYIKQCTLRDSVHLKGSQDTKERIDTALDPHRDDNSEDPKYAQTSNPYLDTSLLANIEKNIEEDTKQKTLRITV